MTRTVTIAPVRKSVTVSAPPVRAFEVFTSGISSWWLPSHKIGKTPFKEIVLEPRVGGRWFERGEDGVECDWGKVLAWEPPSRVVLAWQIDGTFAYRPSLVTEVEVRFLPDGQGTRVELEHRNLDLYAAQSDAMRTIFDSPTGWSGLLSQFKARLDG